MNAKQNLIFPDYDHSNLSIFSSFLHHYGVSCSTRRSAAVDELLTTRRKRNTVFLLIDAMGSAILERHLAPDSFLRSHLRQDLTAVYPCTTVCVTTSLFSGLQPISHAWLAWALYFKEWDQLIEVFPYRDAFTGLAIDPAEKNILQWMGFEPIFSQVERATQGSVKVDCVFTQIARKRLKELAGERLTPAASFKAMLGEIEQKCAEPGDHFIVGYWKSPDDLLHILGLDDPAVGSFLSSADQLLAWYLPQFADANVVISADHGMQDMRHHFRIDELPGLNELLRCPPGGDARAKALYVQAGKEDLFAARFEREIGKEFRLYSTDEVLKEGFLGEGPLHPQTCDFIGDFMAVGVGHSDLLYRAPGAKLPAEFKGHHAGMTAEEMRVPLIIV